MMGNFGGAASTRSFLFVTFQLQPADLWSALLVVLFFERDGEDRVKNIMNKLWKIGETACCAGFQKYPERVFCGGGGYICFGRNNKFLYGFVLLLLRDLSGLTAWGLVRRLPIVLRTASLCEALCPALRGTIVNWSGDPRLA
jgi:hypothetical protein